MNETVSEGKGARDDRQRVRVRGREGKLNKDCYEGYGSVRSVGK